MFLAALILAPEGQLEPQLNQIIALSKSDNRVMKHLSELCYSIGPRVTGSPLLTKAENWALAKFKSFGYANAHLEKWADIPVGFSRGPNNHARMLEPFESEIKFSSNCWMPGTEGALKGHVLIAPNNLDQLEKVKNSLKGAWLLAGATVGMRGAQSTAEDAAVRKSIEAAGINGFVYGAKDDHLHAHGTWKDKDFTKRPTTRELTIRREDWDRLARNVNFGRKTVAEFSMDHIWHKGPVAVHNVVAEIKGTEKPDEVIVIGGHLDSWDAPGSQGASDNGTGSSATLEAARLLIASGLKPKRTIRFILWGGEEQGLLGSTEYVRQHESELSKISACVVDDGGSNYENGCSGIASWQPFFQPAFTAMTAAFPEMPMTFRPVEKYNASGGSDQASFNAKGIPAFFMGKSGSQKYGHIWHTQYDRYEEVVPAYMRQVSTSMAVTSFALANAETMLPRQK
jgi:hypothetical protein